VKSGALNAVPMAGTAGLSALDAVAQQARAQIDVEAPATDVKFCSIDNPDCEACQ
jgi:ribonucleoside-diphosphate reductase alpha chain